MLLGLVEKSADDTDCHQSKAKEKSERIGPIVETDETATNLIWARVSQRFGGAWLQAQGSLAASASASLRQRTIQRRSGAGRLA
jgi:hypothetical protein